MPFGPTIKATRELVLSSVLGKLRKTYGLLVRVKGRFDKQTLAIIYNSMFAPHVFFILQLLKLLSKSDKKHIRVYFSGFLNIFVEFQNGSKIGILYENSEYLILLLKWINNTTDFLDDLEKIE